MPRMANFCEPWRATPKKSYVWVMIITLNWSQLDPWTIEPCCGMWRRVSACESSSDIRLMWIVSTSTPLVWGCWLAPSIRQPSYNSVHLLWVMGREIKRMHSHIGWTYGRCIEHIDVGWSVRNWFLWSVYQLYMKYLQSMGLGEWIMYSHLQGSCRWGAWCWIQFPGNQDSYC